MTEFQEVADNIRHEISSVHEQIVEAISKDDGMDEFAKAMEISELYNRISNLTNILNTLSMMRVSEQNERALYKKLNDHICGNSTLDASALDMLCSTEKLDEAKYNFIEEQIRKLLEP